MGLDTREIPRPPASEGKKGPHRFGTFKGVYLPSILTIFGVIMYLRLGWVVGNVGLVGTLLIVTIASSITLLTGLSIAATATNMKVGGGGAYYIISRSLGVEAGAAVGIPLYLAQTVGISFYIVGFSESVHSLLPHVPMPAIGCGSLVVLTVLAYVSANLALRAQLFIFVIIAASLISLFLGGPPRAGFGLAASTVPTAVSFWIVFSVFFPAVTGIEAGISMSGDLKNPARSLPLGTIAAVLTGYVIYTVIPIFLSSFVPVTVLRTNTMILQDIAFWGELILLGIWGATLSSALGALLGAPRTLQALARDRVVPAFIGKGFGPSNTPRIATGISFLVALTGILLGNINAIAPVLSMFFLTSYGILNLISGLEGMIGNPSWRPTFRTPWPLSLLGAGLCVAAMFMINPGATFIAIFVVSVIYYAMTKRQLRPRWSDIRRSLLLFLARFAVYRLEGSDPDARSWLPNILVLSGAPTERFYLIELADAFTHGKGFLTVAIISKVPVGDEHKESLEKSVKGFLRKRRINALVEVHVSENTISGAKELIRTYGLGPLAPNTFVLGETEKEEQFIAFAELILLLYGSRRNSVIVREAQGVSEKKSRDKEILVWWGGKQQNEGLMLALGYLLQSSPEWKKAKLVLNTIVRSEQERKKTTDHLRRFLEEGRIPAEARVLVETEHENLIPTTIKQFSAGADLVFLGMRPPEEGETPEEYAAYYQTLMKSTRDFPTLVLVLAAEGIEFKDIFK